MYSNLKKKWTAVENSGEAIMRVTAEECEMRTIGLGFSKF